MLSGGLYLTKDILTWKDRYRNIYYLKINDHEYIFRLLTKGEYLSLFFIQSQSSLEADDLLLSKCVLYPSDCSFDQQKAGEVQGLIDRILSLSGFSSIDNIKQDLDRERENMKLLDNQIILIICKAFPHITPSDIDNFDYQTIVHHITLAEELLGTKLEITKQEDTSKIDFEKDNKLGGFPGPTPNGPPTRKRPVKK